MIVFVTCRRSESKCFCWSYVFADCGHEDKRRSKRNFCLCLRTAMIVFVKRRRSESKCFCWSYFFADCNGCVLLRTPKKIEKQFCMSLRTAMVVFVKCMSLRTAMIVFGKCRRSESTCFFRSYVFADCGYGDKEKM